MHAIPAELREALEALARPDRQPPRLCDTFAAALRRRLSRPCTVEEAERLADLLQAHGLVDAPQGMTAPDEMADPARFITRAGRRLLESE